ncbi:MAG: TonB-dependent receptor, partial [Gemmatimonadota bacterium]|nr:TonB-dependent receptor [Gemmatimonadota bacterium]
LLGFEVFEFADPSSQEAIDGSLDVYESKITADLDFGYKLNDSFELRVGANNLLNAYPTQQDSDWTEAGGYWDAVQMGYSGAYYYSRLVFSF